LKNLYDELNLLCYNSRKTVLDTWETGDTTEPKDISNNMIELQQNKETETEKTEDYRNIFIPMKDFIEMYSNDVLKENDLDYSSSSDDEEEISIRPQLLVKKLRAKEKEQEQNSDINL
jgi:hypothetical protein